MRPLPKLGGLMRLLVLMMGFLLLQPPLARPSMTLDVIAVEYPPYTTPDRADDGLVFQRLRSWLASRNLPIKINARFLPPARAQHAVNSSDWCMALYPPSKNTPHLFRKISRTNIVMGFVRRKTSEPFSWDGPTYFKGSRIALLRTLSLSDPWIPYQEAGAKFVFVEAMEQAMIMVLKGRADYAVADSGGLEAFNRSAPADHQLELSSKPVQEFAVGVYLSARCRDILGSLKTNEKGATEHDAPLQN
jgi:polar amino acid transport system substrate-binding protein